MSAARCLHATCRNAASLSFFDVRRRDVGPAFLQHVLHQLHKAYTLFLLLGTLHCLTRLCCNEHLLLVEGSVVVGLTGRMAYGKRSGTLSAEMCFCKCPRAWPFARSAHLPALSQRACPPCWPLAGCSRGSCQGRCDRCHELPPGAWSEHPPNPDGS